jgi:peptidyl-prolyl cis-trans isomerase SurA
MPNAPMTRPLLCLVAALVLSALPPALSAQSPLQAVAFVDERVITRFEVDQRARFLEVFNTAGDLQQVAIDRLVEERLQMAEATRMGIRLTDEQIAEGMAEFAGRANLTTDEFIAAIGEQGIAPESFRDFVIAGLAWREVLRQRFQGRVDITEVELDRGLSLTAVERQWRVLLSEIVLPDVPEAREIAPEISAITSLEVFEDAARQISGAPSAERGGRLDWIPITNLPEAAREMVLEMRPGQVTQPLFLQGAIVFLQLRGRELTPLPGPAAIAVDYAVAAVPGAGTPEGAAEVARIRARSDSCEDFAGATRNLPQEAVRRVENRLSEVPGDIALELARLDERQISTNLRQGGATLMVMLCSRVPAGEDAPDRAQMRNRMTDQRVEQLSRGLLAELRAQAVIRRP